MTKLVSQSVTQSINHPIKRLTFNWNNRECAYLVMPVYPVFCFCDLDLDHMTLTYMTANLTYKF